MANIQLKRCPPADKKDDNATSTRRTGQACAQLLGWDRYGSHAAVEAIMAGGGTQTHRSMLDPFVLAESLDHKLESFYALATRRLSPKANSRGATAARLHL